MSLPWKVYRKLWIYWEMTSGMFRITGMLCVPMVGVWPLLLGNTAGMDQKDSVTVVVAVAYARLVSLLAQMSLRRCRALMPCIMAGMDQINSYVVFVQGPQNPCRGAEAIPMVGIPQLPHVW